MFLLVGDEPLHLDKPGTVGRDPTSHRDRNQGLVGYLGIVCSADGFELAFV